MSSVSQLLCRPSNSTIHFSYPGSDVPGFPVSPLRGWRNRDVQTKARRARLAWTAGGGCPYVISLPLGFVFLDHAVPDRDDAVRVLGDVVFMRHEDDRIAFRVQTIEQRHDLVAGL